MKLVLAALLLITGSVYAESKRDGVLYQANKAISGQSYGMAGCGLGSVIMGNSDGFTQVFASTTNGTSGNQTFGITSGTSNCESPKGLRGSRAADFTVANRLQLETDLARGEGESLQALALLSGCKAEMLAQTLQADYAEIFSDQPENEIVAERVVVRLNQCSQG